MWRGITPGLPIRTGASFVGLGTHRHRVVFYPIARPDPVTGLAPINWIAEITVDNSSGWSDRRLEPARGRRIVHPSFSRLELSGWTFRVLRGADAIFEYPMIDRDPVPPGWKVRSRAMHARDAQTGSAERARQSSTRVLGAAILEHSVTAALQACDARLCAEVSAVVLRNRGAGPFGLLNLLDERCGGVFDDIDAVIPAAEREAFMGRYRTAAGFAMETLNSSPPIIQSGARVRGD